MPRYVRVNTLKTTAEAVINHFINDGYQIVTYNATISYQEYVYHSSVVVCTLFFRLYSLVSLFVFNIKFLMHCISVC